MTLKALVQVWSVSAVGVEGTIAGHYHHIKGGRGLLSLDLFHV